MAVQNSLNITAGGIVYHDGAGVFTGNNLKAATNTISSTDTDGNIIFSPNGSGTVLVPTADVGIGTSTPIHTLEVQGHVGIISTSTAIDTHGMEITANADGFADFKAMDIDYITGALAAGEEDAVILVNIDETLAVGGEIFALEVLSTTEGTDVVGGLKVGIGVNAIHQESGTFGNIDSVLNLAVDVTAAVASGGAGNITMFVSDNDTITMGDAAIWDETEVILDTAASGGGIAPVFAFSTGGSGFTNFVPVDGTNGFRNTGIIDWDSGDLSGWATNASGFFEIRITRTRNNLPTKPIVDKLQLGAETEFKWDKSGDVNLNSLTLVTPLAETSGGTGQNTYTQGDILYASAANTLSKLAIGAASSVLTSDGTDVAWSAGAVPSYSVINLGISYSSPTVTFLGANGTALSASNPAFISVASNVTDGKVITYTITANFTFEDANGTSPFAGSLFGMTTGDTTSTSGTAIPFYLYAAGDTTDANLTFFISRIPNWPSLASGVTFDAGSGADLIYDIIALESVTIGNYQDQKATMIGAFSMDINGSDDWTIDSTAWSYGIGGFNAFNNTVMEKAIQGAATTSFFLANSGTAPTTSGSNEYKYKVDLTANIVHVELQIILSGSPAGEVDALMNLPLFGQNFKQIVGTGYFFDGGLTGSVYPILFQQIVSAGATGARQCYLLKANGTSARWQYDEMASGDLIQAQFSYRLN